MGRVVSLAVGPAELAALSRSDGVVAVRAPQRMRANLDVNGEENGAVAARAMGASGRDVLVAVVDSGIDFKHADFRNADGSTRIRAIWDQLDHSWSNSGGTLGTMPPLDEDGMALGTVYTEAQINAALNGTGFVGSVDLAGHGTFAASAAAGNGLATGAGEPGGVYVGTAPGASLLAVRIGGESSSDFLFPGDLVAALDWIDARADELGKPVVVSLSFGGHIGPHDGSNAEELAIDDFVAKPGRAVVVAAGNEGDIDLHASGSTRGSNTIELFQGGESDIMEVDCWIPGTDRVDLGFTDPSNSGVLDLNIASGDCGTTTRAPNRVTACVGDIDPVNGDREVFFLVEPTSGLSPISAGVWKFHLRDEGAVQNGRFDCWAADEQEFVSDVDPGGRISQPGTARGAITVGAFSARRVWRSQAGPQSTESELGALASFSSPGPTRDGRLKPELVTGGDVVVGAWSIGDGSGSGVAGVPPRPDLVASDGVHVSSRGTSFSAPQVAGAVALIFERNPLLSADSVRDILTQSARSDEHTGTVPNDSWGFGKLDVLAALDSVPLAQSFPGDANCDEVLNDADVDATIAALVAPTVTCVADCNRDGITNAADLVCVYEAIANAGG